MKIAFLGTRGIPNHYGGYEQAVTFLSKGLVDKGHSVSVYNSHNHPYREKNWKGVEIVHCYDPENKTGTAGQFIYDLNCIRHARKKNYDIWLLMGYTSSSIWGRLYPSKTLIISNMDGLEWKRTKYIAPVRGYLKYAERLAVKYSDYFIADSPVIQEYLHKKYNINSQYIPYGAEIYKHQITARLNNFDISLDPYYLLIARVERENNIEMILEGFFESGSEKKLVIVGKTDNSYGKRLKARFGSAKNIIFIGPLFDQEKLQSLRAFCKLYFHGHSVGGTNPSLLEAMASKVPIAAHNNSFNKKVLGKDALYFSSSNEVKDIIKEKKGDGIYDGMIQNNFTKIKEQYNWETIIEQYERFILHCYHEKHP